MHSKASIASTLYPRKQSNDRLGIARSVSNCCYLQLVADLRPREHLSLDCPCNDLGVPWVQREP